MAVNCSSGTIADGKAVSQLYSIRLHCYRTNVCVGFNDYFRLRAQLDEFGILRQNMSTHFSGYIFVGREIFIVNVISGKF